MSDQFGLISIIVSILFFATLLRAFTGFGDALVAMPLLMLCLPGPIAIPLFALISGTIGIVMVIHGRKEIDLRTTWRLTIASLLGVPVGIYYLHHFNDQLIKSLLGIALLIFTFLNLLRPGVIKLHTDRSSYFFGPLSGALGAAYNINGPPIVVYATLRGWSQKDFHTTMQGYFFLSGLSIMIGHGVSGLWTREVFIFYLVSLPTTLLAMLVGTKIAKKIPTVFFHRIANILVGCIGGLLVWQNI
ncbi:MAG: sulfite exporter TauE/SafE family protein [Bdellovibrio sp.]|nr:sulfite exporter TauE/SafE family protein [Bdellovibrio sp.]